jgi:hypothetical protein
LSTQLLVYIIDIIDKLLIEGDEEREREHMRIIKRNHEREKRGKRGRMTWNCKEREILMWQALKKAEKIFEVSAISLYIINNRL